MGTSLCWTMSRLRLQPDDPSAPVDNTPPWAQVGGSWQPQERSGSVPPAHVPSLGLCHAVSQTRTALVAQPARARWPGLGMQRRAFVKHAAWPSPPRQETQQLTARPIFSGNYTRQ